MKRFTALWLLTPVLALAAAEPGKIHYTVTVLNLKVDTSKLDCREVTFGFNNENKRSSVNLSNKALSDSRVLLTSHTTNDAYWNVHLPEGSCGRIEELKKSPTLPATVMNKVNTFAESNGHVLLKGVHLMEHATLTIGEGADALVMSTERWSVAGGQNATVEVGN